MWILVVVDLQVFLLPSPFVLLAQEARLEVATGKKNRQNSLYQVPHRPFRYSMVPCSAWKLLLVWALEQNRKTCTQQMSNQARIQKGLAVAVLSSSCTHLGTSESECSLSSEFFVVSSIWSERLKLQIVMPVRCCFGTSQDLMLHDVPVMTLFDAGITATYFLHQNVTCSFVPGSGHV